MELRQLRYFVAVAEELHFGRAAKRLHLSQPPLSQQIAHLEAEIRVKLLERDRRHVQLTKAGEVFLHRARAIIASSLDATREAQRIDSGYQGRLAIGYMSAVMLVKITQYLKEFHSIAPTADVILRQMKSHEQYVAVVNGEIDVGFVDFAVHELPQSRAHEEVNSQLALRERLMLCVSKDSALAGRRTVGLRELSGAPFIALMRQAFPSFFDTLLHVCKEAGFKPHIVQQVESMPIAVAMASAGFGVALVPRLAAMTAESQFARFIEIEEEVYVDIFLISRADNRASIVRNLREVCTYRDS